MAATLSWQIPGVTSDNTFSVVLVSDQALQNVSLDDFTFRRDDGMFFEASTYATLTQVAGTNNWKLEVTLTGTHDNNFQARLRPNRVTDEDGAMNALLNSASFAVDTGYVGFTVAISGGENIEEGQQVTLTAVVTDADGNTPPGTIQYAWRASRGSFVGAMNERTVDYIANFTGAFDITCEVTRPADATPTSAGPSLTALDEIGVTGQVLNMFVNPAAAASPNSNASLYATGGTVGTLETGSDDILSASITITRIGWNNPSNKLVLNRSGTGHLRNFFSGNSSQSIFLIFDDGTYVELTSSDIDGGGLAWIRYSVPANIIALFDAFDGTDRLLLGVGDAGSVGLDVETGSVTASLTARVVQPLGIESIDEQFITFGTEDYDLVINITGRPDSAKAKGHMEGFGQDWDSVNGQLHIKSEEVTRLINGVNWDIEVVKDMQTLMGQIAYNVVQAAPIFASLGTIHLYRGVPINFDIIIQNIPPLLIPDAELLGLKSELLDYGINVKGEISSTDNFAFSSGNVTIIVPSDSGGADTTYNYAYEIEDGSPGQIMSPKFTPKGDYGVLEFPDVTHALGYEWTLTPEGETVGDQAVWNVFDSTRQVIDPETVEVTPGNLNVTLKFRNIAGAASYAYRLESDTHEVDWTRFTGTLENGFIRTVVPLREGVRYDLHVRVDQPWEGTPIRITVRGGRLCYTLHDDGANSYIIEMNDGDSSWDSGITAANVNILRKILLPSEINEPIKFIVVGDTVYVCNLVEFPRPRNYWIYVFSIDGIETNQRVSTFRKFKLPYVTNSSVKGFDLFNSELYILQNIATLWAGATYHAHMYKVDSETANGATATGSDFWGRHDHFHELSSLTVTEDWVYGIRGTNLYSYANLDGNIPLPDSVIDEQAMANTGYALGRVVGDKVYLYSSTLVDVRDRGGSHGGNLHTNRLNLFNSPVTADWRDFTVRK